MDKKNSSNIVESFEMDLKKLGETYNIPFNEILEIIKKDRELALKNYQMFQERMQNEADDTESTKQQINKALELVIQSSSKLSDLINSASKLWGDTIKAIAIKESKSMSFNNKIWEKKYNVDRRTKIIEEVQGNDEKEKEDDNNDDDDDNKIEELK